MLADSCSNLLALHGNVIASGDVSPMPGTLASFNRTRVFSKFILYYYVCCGKRSHKSFYIYYIIILYAVGAAYVFACGVFAGRAFDSRHSLWPVCARWLDKVCNFIEISHLLTMIYFT